MERTAYLIFALLLCSFLIDATSSEKIHKRKKYHHRHHKTSPPPDLLDDIPEDELGFDKSISNKESEELIKDNNVPLYDACFNKKCPAGQICEIGEDDQAKCVCIPNCPVERDSRRKVCTNHNETWGSDCEVHQMRCRCDHSMPECKNKELSHVHIVYYGECRDMPVCKPEEMSDFPRRMRDWLFNVMRDLADRQELTPHYMKMEQEAETNLTRRWSNAAVWKWCDLDGNTDRSVSRHELFPIKAPLMTLEHCIAPFLDKCDKNDDHSITLKEWVTCLEIHEDDIEEQCDDVRDNADE
ncbi:hypothetical protein LSTR_LSTR014559 [Laodelphax striatellus]|uniref:SPARC/Testican calcium-binding domain-containing protein n=1 Tax=Laodelphax striatellus TaxID=195883 RepID=A0A482XBH0_LAOST|nr:hypothetical protein LSTR_LSTR014559 [Laodelphax striatellus]